MCAFRLGAGAKQQLGYPFCMLLYYFAPDNSLKLEIAIDQRYLFSLSHCNDQPQALDFNVKDILTSATSF